MTIRSIFALAVCSPITHAYADIENIHYPSPPPPEIACTEIAVRQISLEDPAPEGWHQVIPNVNPGDYVKISVGDWQNGTYNRNNYPNSRMFSSMGVRDSEMPKVITGGRADLVDPTSQFGALIGRVGSGKPFLLGNGPLFSVAGEGGPLYAQMNDLRHAYQDNSGRINVAWKFCRK